MTAGEINKALDRNDRESSKLTDELIEAGRGNERSSDILKTSDPLALRYRKQIDERHALRNEIEMRYGPGAPSRLPKGFGPRRKKGR